MRAAGVHHAARRRGGVAAGGARAAARAHAAHRRAHAIQPRTMRKVKPALTAFAAGAGSNSGWTSASNMRIEYSLGATASPTTMRKHAAELVALAPDVILASSAPAVAPLLRGDPHRPDRVRGSSATRSRGGSVESLARPGGNVTGFYQSTISASAGNGWSCSRRSHRA